MLDSCRGMLLLLLLISSCMHPTTSAQVTFSKDWNGGKRAEPPLLPPAQTFHAQTLHAQCLADLHAAMQLYQMMIGELSLLSPYKIRRLSQDSEPEKKPRTLNFKNVPTLVKKVHAKRSSYG